MKNSSHTNQYVLPVNVSAFILAGGKSSRMGTDKGLMPFRGNAMVQHVINCICPVFDKVVIVSNSGAYEQFNLPVIEDEVKGLGPLGGICTALKYSKTVWNFFISCDLPLMDPAIPLLLANSINPGSDAVIPIHRGSLEPLCALYHTKTLSIFEHQIQQGNLKMHDAIARIHATVVEIPESYFTLSNPFHNYNSPDDLTRTP